MNEPERRKSGAREDAAAPAQRTNPHKAILKKLVIAWDADQDLEFDEAMAKARGLLGFKLEDEEPAHRCMSCQYPVASPGLCGECSCEDDCE